MTTIMIPCSAEYQILACSNLLTFLSFDLQETDKHKDVDGITCFDQNYKPKHGSFGSGSSMDFEDDPDYEDEDEDNIYDFAQERDKSLNKYREPVEEDISYEERASPDI